MSKNVNYDGGYAILDLQGIDLSELAGDSTIIDGIWDRVQELIKANKNIVVCNFLVNNIKQLPTAINYFQDDISIIELYFSKYKVDIEHSDEVYVYSNPSGYFIEGEIADLQLGTKLYRHDCNTLTFISTSSTPITSYNDIRNNYPSWINVRVNNKTVIETSYQGSSQNMYYIDINDGSVKIEVITTLTDRVTPL